MLGTSMRLIEARGAGSAQMGRQVPYQTHPIALQPRAAIWLSQSLRKRE